MNTKQKGNIGIGEAIAFFTSKNFTVSIPLTDSQDYDIVVEMNDILYKVQVKYTSQKARNITKDYFVGLRSISGTTSKEYKNVSETNIDYLFIVTKERQYFLIPKKEINQKTAITLNKNYYQKYGVKIEI